MTEARDALDAAARANAARLQECAATADDAASLPYLVLRVTNGNTPSGNTVHAAAPDWPELADARRIDNDQLHALDARNWHELGYAIEALTTRDLVDALVENAHPMLPGDAARLVDDARKCDERDCGCRYQVFARRGGSFAALFNYEVRAQVCNAPRAAMSGPRAQRMSHSAAAAAASADDDSMCVIV